MTDDGWITLPQKWFEPLPIQHRFILDPAGEQFYAGGVGSGKTLSGAFKAFILGELFPGTVGLVGRQTYRALEDTTKRVLLDGDDKPPVIPAELIAKRSETDQSITLHNGSRILFRSFQDANLEKLLSLNLGWFWLDEAAECTEKIWSTLLGRLRHPVGPGIAYGTTNPNGHDWIWRRAHPDGGQRLAELHVAPTESNPHLPADYVARLRAMPREWQKRWVDCSFDTAAGQIWDTWSSAVHTFEPEDVRIPGEWRRLESLDHGTRNPTCVLWASVDRDGNVWVTDEYYDPGIVSQHATAIKQRAQTGVIKADPSVFAQGPDGVSVADLYAKAGIRLRRAVNDVAAGLLRVSEYLEPDPKAPFPHEHPRAGDMGAPRVFVSRKCVNLIREIPDYRWRDLSPSVERNRDNPEEPRKKDDHAADAFRYLLADLPRPTRVVDTAALLEREKRAPDRRTNSAGLLTARF